MSGSIDVVGTSLSVTGDVTVSNVVDVSGSSVVVAGSQPTASLSAVTGNGAGSTVDWGSSKGSHTVVVSWTGTPSALQVNLEGSHDGTTWVDLGEITSASTNPAFKNVQADVRYSRARLVSHTGSLTLTATVAAS